MKNKYYTSRDPIKNYFPLPNEVFALGLSPGALAVYSYLMYIEDRTTYQCHASYKTIGKAVNMSPNTVRKYVTELVERGLIQTERTTIITQDGRKQNGSRVWRLCPVFRAQPGACPPETQKPDAAPTCGRTRNSTEVQRSGFGRKRKCGGMDETCRLQQMREHAETGKIERFWTPRRESRTKPRGRARPAAVTSARSAGSLGISGRGC